MTLMRTEEQARRLRGEEQPTMQPQRQEPATGLLSAAAPQLGNPTKQPSKPTAKRSSGAAAPRKSGVAAAASSASPSLATSAKSSPLAAAFHRAASTPSHPLFHRVRTTSANGAPAAAAFTAAASKSEAIDLCDEEEVQS